jgi:hypothetical protein
MRMGARTRSSSAGLHSRDVCRGMLLLHRAACCSPSLTKLFCCADANHRCAAAEQDIPMLLITRKCIWQRSNITSYFGGGLVAASTAGVSSAQAIEASASCELNSIAVDEMVSFICDSADVEAAAAMALRDGWHTAREVILLHCGLLLGRRPVNAVGRDVSSILFLLTGAVFRGRAWAVSRWPHMCNLRNRASYVCSRGETPPLAYLTGNTNGW